MWHEWKEFQLFRVFQQHRKSSDVTGITLYGDLFLDQSSLFSNKSWFREWMPVCYSVPSESYTEPLLGVLTLKLHMNQNTTEAELFSKATLKNSVSAEDFGSCQIKNVRAWHWQWLLDLLCHQSWSRMVNLLQVLHLFC